VDIARHRSLSLAAAQKMPERSRDRQGAVDIARDRSHSFEALCSGGAAIFIIGRERCPGHGEIGAGRGQARMSHKCETFRERLPYPQST
jgi:hypothetical protein